MKLRNKKAAGLLLSLAVALCAAVPGTLAAQADADVMNTPISIGETTDQSQSEPETLADAETPSGAAEECSCVTNEDGTLTYTEGCPVHEAPAPAGVEAPANEAAAHTGETEAPAEPEKPVHIEGCSDECGGVDCGCVCHKVSLFDRLMKCETYAELVGVVEAATEEELMGLTPEQAAQAEEKMLALEPQPLPEIVIGEDGKVAAEAPSADGPVDSEIIYPTVNFDNVAPFGEPVVG